MEERGGKTIMCSVLFLDIAEYSKKSVTGQISLKDRFNGYLSAAISSVPPEDRIILDTGDGAAINFLGDVEDALKAALSLRESMLKEDRSLDPPLLVRMGINLGPVRLVRDINGQPNIVGDGINVAERIMGFSEPAQILVSRSYYDAVSRLSPQYAGMFHYQGSRTDKHVREHEVYAIGYPGDKMDPHAVDAVRTGEHAVAARGLPSMLAGLAARIGQASPKQRILYGAGALVFVVLAGLLLKPAHKIEEPVQPVTDPVQAASGVEASSAVAASPVSPAGGKSPAPAHVAKPDAKISAGIQPDAKKAAEVKPDVKEGVESKPDDRKAVAQPKIVEPVHPARNKADGTVGYPTEARIAIVCPKGAKLFIDGADKGKAGPAGLDVAVKPGKHQIIVTSTKGAIYSQNVEVAAGKTLRLKPPFCE